MSTKTELAAAIRGSAAEQELAFQLNAYGIQFERKEVIE